jgi:hypothetical protein
MSRRSAIKPASLKLLQVAFARSGDTCEYGTSLRQRTSRSSGPTSHEWGDVNNSFADEQAAYAHWTSTPWKPCSPSTALPTQRPLPKRKNRAQGLGLFLRSLIGLDRGAAKEAFAEFLDGKVMTANQIEFIDLIINHLTEHGVMGAALLYESPFTDLSPHGPDDLFTSDEVDGIVGVLDSVRSHALAA